MMNRQLIAFLFIIILPPFLGTTVKAEDDSEFYNRFTPQDVLFLQGFTLRSLPALPAAPSNVFADNIAAAELGRLIFFDRRFSANGTVSCASCHQPDKYFTDGLVVASSSVKDASGLQAHINTQRNTPSLLVSAYGPWLYWDGRKDSLWAQSLEPLENENEHDFSRELVFRLITTHYYEQYLAVFGEFDVPSDASITRVFVNVGKALMAFERSLQLTSSRFDVFVYDLAAKLAAADTTSGPRYLSSDLFSDGEVRGLRLFVGRAGCAGCHNGPLFTNFEFHNVGIPEANRLAVDLGRYAGIEKLRRDEFNCLSQWSDASATNCLELTYLKAQGPELVGAFKTPSLRNVAATAPYMHSGQLSSLNDVIAHYNNPQPPYFDPKQHPSRPHFDIFPLNLSMDEQKHLREFLLTLTSIQH